MYRKLIGFIVLFMCVNLSACRYIGEKNIAYSSAEEELLSMDGYIAVVQITQKDKEKTNTYQAKHIYQINGNYRTKIVKPESMEGIVTICNGEGIIQYNPNVDGLKIIKLPANDFRNQVFLGSFVKNYLNSHDSTIEVDNVEESDMVVLQANVPGGSRHMVTEKLWINQESRKPTRMEIYNKDGYATVSIEFLEFAYNPQIDESVFTIEK